MQVRHLCGRSFWISKSCRTRLCSECGSRITNEKFKKLMPLARAPKLSGLGGDVRFVTLTFADEKIRWSSPRACRDWIRKRTALLREFFMGRETPRRWRVRGYLAVWEITRGRAGQMHPHLHLLVWSAFLPWRQLRSKWQARTGAWNADVRKVKQGDEALGYILKYVAKPWREIPDEVQAISFYRTRRITTTGEFYGRKLSPHLEQCTAENERVIVRLCCTSCGTPMPGKDDNRPLGRAWKPPPEWSTVRSCEASEIPPNAEAAAMIAVDWKGRELWPDVQRVRLPIVSTGN